MRNAAVMLVIQDGLILGISRRDNQTKFGLPGGKNEENETPEQAAKRETFEETGITVEECVHIFTRDEPKTSPNGEDFHVYCFYALTWYGEPSNSEEGIVKWLTQSELTKPDSAFGDYNTRTLAAFKLKFPEVFLLQ